MNKKLFLLSIFMMLLTESKSQHKIQKDSTSILVSRLNWSSFGVTCNYALVSFLKDDAKKIIQIRDKKKGKKLVNAIADTNVIAIHMILTKLYEPDSAALGTMYHYTGKNIDYWTHTYNQLSWKVVFVKEDSEYVLEKGQVKKIRKYWRKKLKMAL